MSVISSLLVGIVIFLFLFPTMMLFSSMWLMIRPAVDAQTPSAVGVNVINNLGNSTYLYTPDTILTVMYFGLIGAIFLSALYESAGPETLPIGLFFLIPLILVTFPLSDLAHAFYSVPALANVAGYYASTAYLSDNSPTITILISLAYLVFVTTKRRIIGSANFPQGPNIVSG